jgi:hypothetical protein
MAKLTIKEVKDYSLKHYNQGGDVLFECWDDEDIQNALDKGADLNFFDDLFSAWNDQEQNAINSAW